MPAKAAEPKKPLDAETLWKVKRLAAPDVSIRMYHDARLAEARSLRQSVPVVPPYKKWTHNRFLQKWLSYCLDQGYRFADAHTLTPFEVSGEVTSS